MGGAILEPPAEEVVDPEVVAEGGEQGPPEIPSVFSVVDRHIIGRVEVSPPAEDGSRVVRLYSANGASIIEANLAPPLCEFVSSELIKVEIIEEDAVEAEEVEDARSAE